MKKEYERKVLFLIIVLVVSTLLFCLSTITTSIEIAEGFMLVFGLAVFSDDKRLCCDKKIDIAFFVGGVSSLKPKKIFETYFANLVEGGIMHFVQY